ncbi:MAG: pseudouridine-5'-phosphate glycosidase, partial [Pyrinomonadaceae bacterium]|nr:pseudouridine-5'-phosphate glycosidase [Pyrinomonadaceae bacterium]
IQKENEIPSEKLKNFLHIALTEADAKHIIGKEITPFLLSRMSELSDGETLKANIALLKNNAQIASQIAVSLNS